MVCRLVADSQSGFLEGCEFFILSNRFRRLGLHVRYD